MYKATDHYIIQRYCELQARRRNLMDLVEVQGADGDWIRRAANHSSCAQDGRRHRGETLDVGGPVGPEPGGTPPPGHHSCRASIPVSTPSLRAVLPKEASVPKFGPLGRDVYERTYSRRKPDGTHEDWDDTVARVVAGNLELVDSRYHLPDEAERLTALMADFKIIPRRPFPLDLRGAGSPLQLQLPPITVGSDPRRGLLLDVQRVDEGWRGWDSGL